MAGSRWWSSSSGRIELQFTDEQVFSIPCQGDAELSVRALRAQPDVAAQLVRISQTTLEDELREYGCWTDEELQDREWSELRLLWLATLSIQEEP